MPFRDIADLGKTTGGWLGWDNYAAWATAERRLFNASRRLRRHFSESGGEHRLRRALHDGLWRRRIRSWRRRCRHPTFTEMLDRVRCIAGATSIPFIADGDTGYGGLLNVDRTVRGYAAAGASGIQLEDQEFPKKCGHTEFRRVIPADDAVAKIRVAVDARPSRDFLIVARTDARYAEGMDSALRRAERFLDAGADVLFVESPESLEELRRVAETFKGAALLANMVEGGRTPYLSTGELAAMGSRSRFIPDPAF